MLEIKNSKIIKRFSNKYFLSGLLFLVWMIFLDTHSYLIHKSLNSEIKEANRDIEFYESELSTMRTELYELKSDPEAFEKYAREKFWMHKKGEHIVLIEEDLD